MSYTPETWTAGDTVTAAKLNNMESGISANDTKIEPFIVTLTPTAEDLSGVMDKTDVEIRAAFDAGKRILFEIAGGEVRVNPTAFTPYEMGGAHVISVIAIFTYSTNGTDFLVEIATDVGEATYSTKIFPLTPMP